MSDAPLAVIDIDDVLADTTPILMVDEQCMS
jgi:hypothetical protein